MLFSKFNIVPIINLQCLTEDPEIREILDMYWALKENTRPLYNKHDDFFPKYGLDRNRLAKNLNQYFVAFLIGRKFQLSITFLKI